MSMGRSVHPAFQQMTALLALTAEHKLKPSTTLTAPLHCSHACRTRQPMASDAARTQPFTAGLRLQPPTLQVH